MFSQEVINCPVCNAILGYLTKNEVCSFVCRECQWIFSWTAKGKMGKPIKVNGKKPDTCNCLSCQYYNEQKALKNLKRNS